MRRKVCLSAIVLMTLTALFSLAGLFTRNAYCKLEAPEVDVIPPEVSTGEQVVVRAYMNVLSC